MINGKLLHQPNEPIPGDILERLTKPKEKAMYQLTVMWNGKRVAVGPKVEERPVLEDQLAVIKKAIIQGREKTWADPEIVILKFKEH